MKPLTRLKSFRSEEFEMFVFLTVTAVIFFGELFLKNYIESHMKVGETRKSKCPFLWIRNYRNTGAFLNFGEKKRPLIAAVSVFFTVCICVFFVMTLGSRGNLLLKTGLSFLLGGAFSNTYDRLKRKYVVDYFSFHVKWAPLRKVVFNLSDFCILIGALLTVLTL